MSGPLSKETEDMYIYLQCLRYTLYSYVWHFCAPRWSIYNAATSCPCSRKGLSYEFPQCPGLLLGPLISSTPNWRNQFYQASKRNITWCPICVIKHLYQYSFILYCERNTIFSAICLKLFLIWICCYENKFFTCKTYEFM